MSDDAQASDKSADAVDRLEYHQKRRTRNAKDVELIVGVTAAKAIAAARKGSVCEMA